MKLQKHFYGSTILPASLLDSYVSGRAVNGSLIKEHDDIGWTVSGLIDGGSVMWFCAVCEDGMVVRTLDGEMYSTSDAVFDEFIENFRLVHE